ncbi:MAG TPA: type II toxin-antitoxin system HicB family antitoxin [Treponemataceae bacterium]|jgi:predicted RNase H-like HicB family nuclease|nr:type II toxin-antitoxin system HicB family antitoxin [Treponemataceae bacterium]HQL05710.1 type II toxin-antitoxin system HicB family antitoxin [Treponemataceae bacterium]
MKYAIFLEKDTNSDYGVTVPDLPGCFSAGSTIEEALDNAQEAILTHIEGLLLDNEMIPHPSSIEVLKNSYSSPEYFWSLVPVDIGSLSKNVKRVNITISDNILSKIDAFTKQEGSSRSGFLASAALEYISTHSN